MGRKRKAGERQLYNKNWIAKRRKEDKVETISPNSEESEDDMQQNMCTLVESTPSVSTSDINIRNEGALQMEQRNSPVDILLNINDTSSDDSESDYDCSEQLSESLKEWVNHFEIKGNAVDNLLKILKQNGHNDLPGSSRTLLGTLRNVEILIKSNMDYYFFGLQSMLLIALKRYPADIIQNIDTLILSMNIDGLPLFKSNNTSVWPVLAAVSNLKPVKPFTVALTVGKTKPSNLEFLDETIAELNDILRNGLDFNEKHFEIKLLCVICDAPAKAFVKCVKQFSGYYGCDKCNQRGYYIGRITYQTVNNLVLRTDQSFRNRTQQEHHKESNSPFMHLPNFDMINQFPIDYMHQVCLGVVKKLLITWIRGPRQYFRLSNNQVCQISAKLLALKPFIPREFARKPRGLHEIDRWKATELRQFLLYTGQFVLKGILPDTFFEHFMCLTVAINIYVNESIAARRRNYAHRLLEYFVRQSKDLYGQEFCVYNVHSLLHLKKETENFGSLDNCAAWPFENYMQQLQRKVRGGNNPAAQLVKRIFESAETNSQNDVKERKIVCKKPNNMYKTDCNKYVEVIRPANREEDSFLCRVYYTPEHSFSSPCNSDIIGHCQFTKFNYEVKAIDKGKLVTRCIQVPSSHRNKIVFVPLQHDFNM